MLWASWIVMAAAAGTAAPPPIAEGEVPKGWVVVDPPREAADWSCINQSPEHWKVQGDSTDRGSIVAAAATADPGLRVELPDGVLVGENRGEWGGSIEWQPKRPGGGFAYDGLNPAVATVFNGDVFIAEGLMHMDQNRGSVLRFGRGDGPRWRITGPHELGAAPTAGVRANNSDWILLTSVGVIRMELPRLWPHTLYRNRQWEQIYPDSIRPLGRSWLIGTRHGVIRLVPLGERYIEQWLVPASCRQLKAPDCKCAA
ncbi:MULTISPECIES: hypothetical protein [Lysobacter]|uniref:hypothetical protein n=1 Tax=Lysobacter TaxID=68 RepID=UPI001F21F4A2|nr:MULTISPECIES: hypothetical protein [Lysobacter]UJB17234.1 hypothetical protein L1A79_12615 [Lysobacter capsici]UJQ29043.1 hypothetical protein L2D09_02250 [Lysobacter gummosus]